MTYSVAIIKGVALPHLTPAMLARLWLALARFACVAQENLGHGLGEHSQKKLTQECQSVLEPV